MKRWILGFFAATLAVPLQAAIITEQYDFALPTAYGIYSAGHTFQITATYDNTGTVMHVWNDGADGTADFGSPDDTVNQTSTLATYPGYTSFSDASLTVSGLLLPNGATPLDQRSINLSQVYAYGDPLTSGVRLVQLFADDLEVALNIWGPTVNAADPNGRTGLFISQSYITTAGQTGITQTIASIPVALSPRVVPEPPVLALIGLGLAGFGLARRRNRQKSTV